ncbi:hypothetical protein OSTOST_04416, partial [Ostertagia ostertagi]
MPGSHIQSEYLTRDARESILLLQDQPLTALIIQDTHCRCGHQGVNGSLANLRLIVDTSPVTQAIISTLRERILETSIRGKYVNSEDELVLKKAWNAMPFRPSRRHRNEIVDHFNTTIDVDTQETTQKSTLPIIGGSVNKQLLKKKSLKAIVNTQDPNLQFREQKFCSRKNRRQQFVNTGKEQR